MENQENKASVMEKIKDNLKYHLVDSTALMGFSSPIFAALETSIAGISHENSIHARLLAVGLTYAGLGRIFSKGMDLSRKMFHIKPETKERLKQLHDASYATAYNILISPLFYYAAGVRDIKQIAMGTAMSMGFAFVAGGPMGYAVDAFRDLTGLKSSERVPELVRRQNPNIKKGLAALLTAGMIAATAGVYSVIPDKQVIQNQLPSAQQAEVIKSSENLCINALDN
jgi:hypothetical protein